MWKDLLIDNFHSWLKRGCVNMRILFYFGRGFNFQSKNKYLVKVLFTNQKIAIVHIYPYI